MTQLQQVPRRRKSLAIVLIVTGPFLLVAAAVCAILGTVTLTWIGFSLDVKAASAHANSTVDAGDGTDVTLFADAAEAATAETCVVTGPDGASVELRTDGVPAISQTSQGVTYEAFAWFEGYGADEFGPISELTIHCEDATAVAVTGVKGEVDEAQGWFIATGVLAVAGVAAIVAGIWWLVAVVRYNRRMREAFAAPGPQWPQ